jgi:hypothetical protein
MWGGNILGCLGVVKGGVIFGVNKKPRQVIGEVFFSKLMVGRKNYFLPFDDFLPPAAGLPAGFLAGAFLAMGSSPYELDCI